MPRQILTAREQYEMLGPWFERTAMLVCHQFEPRRAAVKPHLMIPTDELASYYVHTPPPSGYASWDRYPDLSQDIAQNGVQTPLTVATDGTWAHLKDGYHRAAEAQRQGITHLPVNIEGHDERTYPHDMKLNPVGPALQNWVEGKFNISPKAEEYGTSDHLFRQKMHQQGLDVLRDYRKELGIL